MHLRYLGIHNRQLPYHINTAMDAYHIDILDTDMAYTTLHAPSILHSIHHTHTTSYMHARGPVGHTHTHKHIGCGYGCIHIDHTTSFHTQYNLHVGGPIGLGVVQFYYAAGRPALDRVRAYAALHPVTYCEAQCR